MTSIITANWQTVIALVCVAAALVYLSRRLLRAVTASGRSSCADCTHSPVTGVRQKPLVTLDTLKNSGAAIHKKRG